MRLIPRRGFALLSVLWFLAGIASLSLASMLLARGALATSTNRIALTRAEWRAEECIARARSAMLEHRPTAERGARPREGVLTYRDAVLTSSLVRECPGEVMLEPVGIALDLNMAGEGLLGRVLRQRGIPDAIADSLVDALMDWRDEDDSVRSHGAEREWYAARGEPSPRNGDLASAEELRSVRGFARWMSTDGSVEGIEQVLSVEKGKVLLDAAPLSLLAALPGLNATGAAALELHRLAGGAPFPELLSIISVLPEASRAAFEGAFVELGDVATVRPEAWILRARSSGDPVDARAQRLFVTIELRLTEDGARHAITRRRTWS